MNLKFLLGALHALNPKITAIIFDCSDGGTIKLQIDSGYTLTLEEYFRYQEKNSAISSLFVRLTELFEGRR